MGPQVGNSLSFSHGGFWAFTNSALFGFLSQLHNQPLITWGLQSNWRKVCGPPAFFISPLMSCWLLSPKFKRDFEQQRIEKENQSAKFIPCYESRLKEEGGTTGKYEFEILIIQTGVPVFCCCGKLRFARLSAPRLLGRRCSSRRKPQVLLSALGLNAGASMHYLCDLDQASLTLGFLICRMEIMPLSL